MTETDKRDRQTMSNDFGNVINMVEKLLSDRLNTDNLIKKVIDLEDEKVKELLEIVKLQNDAITSLRDQIKSLVKRMDEQEGVLVDIFEELTPKEDKIKLIRYGIKGLSNDK